MKGGWIQIVCLQKKIKVGSLTGRGSLDTFGQISGTIQATGGYNWVVFF